MENTLDNGSFHASTAKGIQSEIESLVALMREKVRQLELLNELSSVLNSSLDPREVRNRALEVTRSLLHCESAALDLGIGASAADDETSIYASLSARGRVIGVLSASGKQAHAKDVGGERRFTHDDQAMLRALAHQIAAALDNSRLHADLKLSFHGTVEVIVEAIEKKDRYTGGHTKRVVFYSEAIGRRMGLRSDELERLRLGALLHDVGKIGVEDKILKKDSPLSPDEWREMQKHPDLGFEIMSRVSSLEDVVAGMRFHHERWDGKGYPFGLQGDAIPMIARIISVADTYDAMVSTRPYRKGIPVRRAYEEILRYRGSQFDPAVVDAFQAAFESGQMGRQSEVPAESPTPPKPAEPSNPPPSYL